MFSFFNAVLEHSFLVFLSLFSFATIFTVRQLFIPRSFFAGAYYITLASILFIAAYGGGGVQNDAYKRLEQFIVLEHNGQLQDAKANPEQFDGMFQIDLQQFNNVAEFREYLEKHDATVDKAEAVSLGWLYAVIAELSLVLVCVLRWLLAYIKKMFSLKRA